MCRLIIKKLQRKDPLHRESPSSFESVGQIVVLQERIGRSEQYQIEKKRYILRILL